MDSMTPRPSNMHQLLQRIKHEFGIKYNRKQSNELTVKISEFFKNHQFDEWPDIVDDINGGYDDCCCKEILYQQLNIVNIKQKQCEYLRLKKCLDPICPINIERIKHKMMKTFCDAYNQNIATKIVTFFKTILIEENFDDIEDVIDDIEDIDNSEILSKLEEIEELSNDDQYDLNWIKHQIQYIVLYSFFHILSFDFNVTPQDNKYTESVIHRYQDIYPHSQSLINAKSIDIINSRPILYWLLNLYSKQRSIKYRDNILDANMGHIYNSNDWWLENKYCQWIGKAYPNQARDIKIAIAELTKRVLPVINYHSKIFPVICDRLNDVALYALAFHNVAHRIKQLMSSPELEFNVAPIQIDYWIIPQMTRPGHAVNPFESWYPEEMEHKLEDSRFMLQKSSRWDIKNILNHHKLGNIEGNDFLVEYAMPEFEQLHQQIFKMLHKYLRRQNISEKRLNRYVFIIDRRRPDTVKHQNVSIKPVIKSKKPWPDTIYLFGPKSYRNKNGDPNVDHKLPADWELFPELWLALSKNNILHTTDHKQSLPLRLTDALNRYKFGFSYHLSGNDNILAYWYCNSGGAVFELRDIKWAFSRFFEKINGKEQQLDEHIMDDINNHEKLPNVAFEKFEKQVNMVGDVKELEDAMTLNDYNIKHGSTLHLVLRLCVGCFIGNTNVLLLSTKTTIQAIPIKDINIGDELLTFNLDKNKQEIHTVKNVLEYQINELVKITFENGSTITCTVYQSFYIPPKQKWCCIESIVNDTQYGKLCVGDCILNNESEMMKITTIEYEFRTDGDNVTVYALHLDKIHNFYANGILVHNAMQIFIKTKTGKITLDLEPTDTIRRIKDKIEKKLNIPIKAQKLFYTQQQLHDDEPLHFYNIQNQSILRLDSNNFGQIIVMPFGSDASTMHISKALTTKQIPTRTRERFVNILHYMRTFAVAHGRTAIREFKNEETLFRIVNYGFHCLQTDEILYVIMEGQCKSNQIIWKMKDKLYTKQNICELFSWNESGNKLPSVIRLKSRFQNKLNMKNQLLYLLSKDSMKKSIIENAKWNSRNKIPIVNIQKKCSLIVKLSKDELEKRIISHFSETNDVILIPIIRFDEGSYCLQYVWIVQLDVNIHIGLALRLNQQNDKIDISAIYVNICDEHQLIPHEYKYKCNECISLGQVDMCLTDIVIQNNRGTKMNEFEQKSDEFNSMRNKIRLLENTHIEDAQKINALHQRNHQICNQYTQTIQQLKSQNARLKSAADIDQLGATKLKTENQNLIRINNYYYEYYVSPRQIDI